VTFKEYVYLYLFALLKTLKSSLVAALTVFSAFLAPIGDLLFFVSALVLVDFTTGVIAATYRDELRESKKMMRSVYKFGLYMLVLIVAHLFDRTTSQMFQSQILSLFLGPDSLETISRFKFFAAIAFIIVIREMKSIDENWGSIFSWSFIRTGTVLYENIMKLIDIIKSIKKNKTDV